MRLGEHCQAAFFQTCVCVCVWVRVTPIDLEVIPTRTITLVGVSVYMRVCVHTVRPYV